jgi:DNA-binding transcriptional regulator GbsR (MarR family)
MGRQSLGEPDPRPVVSVGAAADGGGYRRAAGDGPLQRVHLAQGTAELESDPPGDRRDHFEAETDIWEVAARIAAGRKQREIDPAIEALRACVADAANDPGISSVASKRLNDMLAFTETVDGWFSQMLAVPRPKLVALMRLGAKIVGLLPGKPK